MQKFSQPTMSQCTHRKNRTREYANGNRYYRLPSGNRRGDILCERAFLSLSETLFPQQKSWLSDCYEYLRNLDIEYSLERNFNTSVKLTTVKPSGTLSLLPNVTPGCHPGIYEYYIRRIRIATENPLIHLCRSNGYEIEYQKNFDGSEDKSTCVVSFPCSYRKNTVLANTMSAIDQLEVVKELQYNWSDNAVSCTVYYRKEELEDIKNWLALYFKDNMKGICLLLKLFVLAGFFFQG